MWVGGPMQQVTLGVGPMSVANMECAYEGRVYAQHNSREGQGQAMGVGLLAWTVVCPQYRLEADGEYRWPQMS